MQTVLFIDDDSIYNLIHRQLAEKTAFAKHILISVSPVSALVLIQELSRMKTIPLPEVIFLDLMMPLMDGFGFLDEFEKLPEYLI
jgi:CheY-like chemotaxis protein